MRKTRPIYPIEIRKDKTEMLLDQIKRVLKCLTLQLYGPKKTDRTTEPVNTDKTEGFNTETLILSNPNDIKRNDHSINEICTLIIIIKSLNLESMYLIRLLKLTTPVWENTCCMQTN